MVKQKGGAEAECFGAQRSAAQRLNDDRALTFELQIFFKSQRARSLREHTVYRANKAAVSPKTRFKPERSGLKFICRLLNMESSYLYLV